MKQSDDGSLSLLQFIFFQEQEISEYFNREHTLHMFLNLFVPAFSHISDKFKILYEILPSTIVFFLANLKVILESTFFEDVFIDTGVGKNFVFLFGKSNRVEVADVGLLQLFYKFVQDIDLILSVYVLPDDTEQPENLEIFLLDKVVVIFLSQHLLSQFVNQDLIDEIFH